MPAPRRRHSQVADSGKQWRSGTAVTCLLDVNVLIALIDPMHTHHERAHDWFGSIGKSAWASCPLTQNGVLRIVAHARYPHSPGPPAHVGALLARFCAQAEHHFWADDLSVLDSETVKLDRLLSSTQMTDTYLLALAVKNEGCLATFDKRLVTDAVRGGREALHVI